MIVYDKNARCWTSDEDPLWAVPMSPEEFTRRTTFESYTEFYQWYGITSLVSGIKKAVDEDILNEVIEQSTHEGSSPLTSLCGFNKFSP